MLFSRGYTHSPLSQFIIWVRDTSGQEYQVLIDGEYLLFGKRRPSGGVDTHRRMNRSTYFKLFGNHANVINRHGQEKSEAKAAE